MGDGARSVDDYEFRAARCGVIGHPTDCGCGGGLAGSWKRAVDAGNAEIDAAIAAANRKERCLDLHGYGCNRAECGRAPVREGDIRGIAEYIGPATSADLLELDAVPDPVDSDAPGVPYGSRTA